MVGFPGGAVVKNPPANAGDGRDRILIPGKIPWGRKWQPIPVFLPGNSMDRRAWCSTKSAAKSQTLLSN